MTACPALRKQRCLHLPRVPHLLVLQPRGGGGGWGVRREDFTRSQEGTRFWTSCSLSRSVGKLYFLLRRAQSLPLEQAGAYSFSQTLSNVPDTELQGKYIYLSWAGTHRPEGRPQRVGEMQYGTQSTGSGVGQEGWGGCFWRAGLRSRVTQACRGQCSPVPHASGSHADPVELPGL